MAESRAKLVVAFATVYVIWGSTYLAIRYAIETLPPLSMTGLRCLLAGAILHAWGRARGSARPSGRQWLAALLTGTLLFLGGQGTLAWAEQRVPSGVAALILATVPLWMTLLHALTRGVRTLRARTLAGILLGFVGIALLFGPSAEPTGRIDPLGAAVLVGAALSWAVGSLLSKHVPRPAALASSTGLSLMGGGVSLLVAGAVIGELSGLHIGSVAPRSIAAFAYLMLFGSVAAFAAYGWLLERVSLPALSTHAYVNPLVAVTLGTTLGGEPLTPRLLLVAALIVVAVVLTLSGSRRPAPNRGGRRPS